MSVKLATWLRVTPPPTTLAESSAIYQALSRQGRISVFAKCKDCSHEQVDDSRGSSSTFYAVFPHEPPTLRTTFEVPVYHGLPSARDEDPFNIRGLQDRKPMPAPKTFSCVLEKVPLKEIRSNEKAVVKGNPYNAHFTVEEDGQIQGVLTDLNAPPGIARGCAIRTQGHDGAIAARGPEQQDESTRSGKPRRINMGSLTDMWHEANKTGKHKGPPKEGFRVLLNADTPLGQR